MDRIRRLSTNEASEYLYEHYGLRRSAKSLRNDRCANQGPRWKYFGRSPSTTPQDVDDWVQSELIDQQAYRRRLRDV